MCWEQDVNEPWVQVCTTSLSSMQEKRCDLRRRHDQKMGIHTRKATDGALFTFRSHDKNLAQLSGRLIKYLRTHILQCNHVCIQTTAFRYSSHKQRLLKYNMILMQRIEECCLLWLRLREIQLNQRNPGSHKDWILEPPWIPKPEDTQDSLTR